MTIEFEGSLNRLLNPTDPDRGCSCPIYLDIELEVSSSRLSIGFSVTSYTREGGQLGSYRMMGASMLDVQRLS